MDVRRLGAGIAIVLAVTACGGGGGATAAPTAAQTSAPAPAGSAGGGAAGATGGPVAAGGDVCALLGPGDFATVGLSGAGAPTRNPDTEGAYCVYAGKSGGTGGLELDAFVTTDAADADGVWQNVRSFLDTGNGKALLPGPDDVAIDTAIDTPPYAAIAVRKGRLVFGISIPTGTRAADQLVALAKLVLDRASALTR